MPTELKVILIGLGAWFFLLVCWLALMFAYCEFFMVVTLIPVTMVRFNDQTVYAPSRLRSPKKVTQKEFIEKYADYPICLSVSFEKDAISNSQEVTAYNYGLDGAWMIGE